MLRLVADQTLVVADTTLLVAVPTLFVAVEALLVASEMLLVGASGVTPAPIEIALGGVIVRVRGEADPRALTTVLKALRGRT
jgi:hypothetical protein